MAIAPNLTPEEQRVLAKLRAHDQETDRLQREGQLKPFPEHLQAKMDASGGAAPPGEETPWEQLQREESEAGADAT